MKKWLVVMVAVWLTSCSSSGESESYYRLPIAQGGVQSSTNQGNRLLWVEQIAVPDYLAGSGMVYQTSDVQYMIANNNLWVSPLDQQLRNTLVADLSIQLLGWIVASQLLRSTQDALNVTVTGFHGWYDDKVIVSGEWLLNHQGQLIKRPFHIEAVQTKDDYDEMAKVLANAWNQKAMAIAQELKHIP